MPDITVEVRGSGYDKNDTDAHLGGEELRVEETKKYDAKSDSTCVYILVDLSTSMYSTFGLVKQNIVYHIENMGANDKLVLMTFGETEVKTVLSGGEEKDAAINAVNALQCNENGTLFYEALSKAYQLSNSTVSTYDREYVIAFSDGIDYQKGSTTFGEVKKLYESRSLPLYAACASNASKESADAFGEMARASGGDIAIIQNEDTYKSFRDTINDVTLIKLTAASNHADGKEKQLSLKIGDSQVECNIPIARSLPDNTSPSVVSINYDGKKKVIAVEFSESVLQAGSASSYKITDPSGKIAEIASVHYSDIGYISEITLKDGVFNGTYEVELMGITDNSKEKNELSGVRTLEIRNSVSAESKESETGTISDKPSDEAGFPLWAIILIVVGLILVIGAVIAAVAVSASRKDNSEGKGQIDIPVSPAPKAAPQIMDYAMTPPGEVKHHIMAGNSARIRLNIKTGKTSEQNIELSIVSSIIIGRSDSCDVYIDDTKMSRQHFVIEYDEGNFYIMDLQSRNGTMLNGIRVGSRQRLSSGDKIFAGLSDIIITVIG